MDRREETQHETNQYAAELKQQEKLGDRELENQYMLIDGVKFRIPYRIIRKVTFSNISKEQLRDIEHASRLQYRLMLKDAVLKATVNFIKGTINITYNQLESDNLKDKISQQELIAFIEAEGVRIDRNHITERDYDYVKEFYTYAFNPARIREHPPYSYTKEQWKKMKPEWEAKQVEYEIKKRQKFKEWQEQYEREYILGIKPEEMQKQSLVDKILGRKPKPADKDKGKGFWFHGV
ncbi:MAG: hypothetical protein KGH65_04700 [Candidatus Micrarchaeota archaeon]|nr:hypothetical protein [Candidatus Micrarchaeota archaeon]